MNVRVYITDLPLPACEVHPIAITPDVALATLPPHPHRLNWRYFATTDTRDTMLAPHRYAIEDAIELKGHCVLCEPLDLFLTAMRLNAYRNRGGMAPREAAVGNSGGGRADRQTR